MGAGSGLLELTNIFNSLVQNIIIWLRRAGSDHSLMRLYRNDRRPHQHSSDGQRPHGGFLTCFNILRQSNYSFSSIGEVSGAFGTLRIAPGLTSSDKISAYFIVTITLSNRERMWIFLERGIAQLPMDWVLDWLEMQHRFSSQVW